jgi:hypothetical protein
VGLAAAFVPDLTPLRGSRDFRALLASRTVAWLGTQAADVAILVQARQLTGSPLAVGLVGLAELGPLLGFGLYGGVLADRLDRRAIMRWCEPCLAACAAPLLLSSLLPRPQAWPLYAIAAVMTSLASVQRPSFDAAVPRLAPGQQQTAAMALMSMAGTTALLLGSSVGGVLAVTPGAYSVHGLDVAGFAVSFAILSWLPPLPPAPAGQSPAAAGVSRAPRAARDIAGGLRYAASRGDLMGSCLADLVAMTFAYPDAMLPFLAVILHAPWAVGLMFAAPTRRPGRPSRRPQERPGGQGATAVSG